MTFLHISWGGPDRKIKDPSGKVWHFEDHPYSGPTLTDKKGNIKNRQPAEKSPFWTFINYWIQDGKKVDENSFCIYTMPEKIKMVCMVGKNYALEGSEIAKKYGDKS